MLRVRNGPPVDYCLCDQVVTLYHQTGGGQAFACTRTVFRGAFLDWKKVKAVDKTGSREANGFLLVLPSGWDGRPVWAPPEGYDALREGDREGKFTLKGLDKVLLGVGPGITTREEWAGFLPAKVSGLVVVRDVDPKYWRGNVTHVEAGG